MRAPGSSVADQLSRMDRADAVRWIACFVLVVAAHGMAALTLLPSLAAFGWARASMSSVSSSRTDDPELCTIRLLSKCPSWSMVNATLAMPCSWRARAAVG